MSRGGFRGRKRVPGAEFSRKGDGREAESGPTPLFPKYQVPTAKELSQTEKAQVDHYRRIREEIHDGPYYTVLSGPPSYGKQGVPARAQFDPFQGMDSYGQRYVREARTLPDLTARPYVLSFFPKALWPTIDKKYVGTRKAAGRKRGFEDVEEDEDIDEARHKRHAGVDDEDEGSDTGAGRRGDEDGLEDEEEEGEEEEIVDDDFEDDEDDMGGDYNAEQYFDGGDDDMDGFDGGGGGDDLDAF